MARRVTLYTRPGCHLCEDVLEDLQLLQLEQDLAVEIVDITAEPEVFERYQALIPVVDVEGGPLLMAPITRAQLRIAVAAP